MQSGTQAGLDRAAVVGAGQMGNGIAHVFATSGHAVTLIDVNADALAKGRDTIARNLDRQVKKGAIEASAADAALARIATSTSLDAVADAAIIVEAATERTDLKFRIFEDLDRLAPAGAILASNTSSISITEIAARTKREPGSLIPGVPASVTRQTSRPSLRASRTRGIELCSVCSSTRIKVALIPRLCSSKPVRRVSSQQTRPARVSASMARGEISPMFPSGVATKIN